MEFKFDDKIKAVDFEIFKETGDMHLKNMPYGSVEALMKITEVIEEAGLSWKVDDLFVAGNKIIYPSERKYDLINKEQIKHDLPIYETPYDHKLANIDKYIARIGFEDPRLSDSETSLSVAISFDAKGMQVAFGTKIHVCSNMNILQPDHLFNINGKDKKKQWKQFVTEFGAMLQNIYMEREKELGRLNALRGLKLGDPIDTLDRMVGQMYRFVEEKASYDGKDFVMYQGNITKFMRKVLADIHARKIANEAYHPLTAYDFYQYITEISTHQEQISNRIGDTFRAFEFIKDFFGIEFLDEVQEAEAEVVEENWSEQSFSGNPATEGSAYPSAEEIQEMRKLDDKSDTQRIIHEIGTANETPEEEIIPKTEFPDISID